jgi:hypothetical protein
VNGLKHQNIDTFKWVQIQDVGIDVGLLLSAIREGKKYRERGYTDFGKYMEERWGMSKGRGWQLIIAGVIGSELFPIGKIIPTHESQIRPLARLGGWKEPKPELWNEAWGSECDLAGEKKSTEKEVETIVNQIL